MLQRANLGNTIHSVASAKYLRRGFMPSPRRMHLTVLSFQLPAVSPTLYGIPEGIREQAENRYLAKVPDLIELMREMYRTIRN